MPGIADTVFEATVRFPVLVNSSALSVGDELVFYALPRAPKPKDPVQISVSALAAKAAKAVK